VADEKLLRIYLNDHLAAATVATRLARRCLRSNRGTELGGALDELARDLADDRRTLEALMAAQGIRRNRAKQAAGVVAERLGLLKLNGRIVHYSPLSRVLELEGLGLLVAFNGSLWRTLGNDALAERAARNVERLERAASGARNTAFGDGPVGHCS
jgi:hypothetical protein